MIDNGPTLKCTGPVFIINRRPDSFLFPSLPSCRVTFPSRPFYILFSSPLPFFTSSLFPLIFSSPSPTPSPCFSLSSLLHPILRFSLSVSLSLSICSRSSSPPTTCSTHLPFSSFHLLLFSSLSLYSFIFCSSYSPFYSVLFPSSLLHFFSFPSYLLCSFSYSFSFFPCRLFSTLFYAPLSLSCCILQSFPFKEFYLCRF